MAEGSKSPVGVEASDEDLVARARSGDRNSFDFLVIRYKDRIYNLCFRKLGDAEEAMDASQEAFLKAYRALRSFEGKSQFFTWLFRIALNCTFTRAKRRGREREVISVSSDAPRPRGGDDDGAGLEHPDVRSEPQAAALERERARIVREAIATLDEEQHQVVVMRDMEGLAYEEIAAALDIPVGSVKSRLHRARLVLRDKLKVLLSLDEVN